MIARVGDQNHYCGRFFSNVVARTLSRQSSNKAAAIPINISYPPINRTRES